MLDVRHQLFGTDERQMQELQFEFFVPLEHAEAAMQATWDVTKDWHLPPQCDPDRRPYANCEWLSSYLVV